VRVLLLRLRFLRVELRRFLRVERRRRLRPPAFSVKSILSSASTNSCEAGYSWPRLIFSIKADKSSISALETTVGFIFFHNHACLWLLYFPFSQPSDAMTGLLLYCINHFSGIFYSTARKCFHICVLSTNRVVWACCVL